MENFYLGKKTGNVQKIDDDVMSANYGVIVSVQFGEMRLGIPDTWSVIFIFD